MLHGRGVQDCSSRKKGIQVIFEETFTGHPFLGVVVAILDPLPSVNTFACRKYHHLLLSGWILSLMKMKTFAHPVTEWS